MKKNLSLQWQLTILTALLVILACLVLNSFISTSAVLYMGSIGDSFIAIFPEEVIKEDSQLTNDLIVDVPADISKEIRKTQREFWAKSLLITFFIALASSTLTYFIVGFALKPLKQFENQLEEIQVKNINQPISVKSSTREIVLLENSFNRMLKRLEETFFAQRQFSASAAHELCTPLAIMKTKLEVFHKQQTVTTEDYVEAFDMIEVQANRLSNVVYTLLEMTETQAATKTDSISLSEIIEEVICDLTQLAIRNQVQLVQIPGEAIIVGNDTLICRAIYNLIENAIKYNRANGKVTVEIRQEGSFAKIIITDTGIGIDSSAHEQIFEPFFRVDKSRSRSIGGAGLGLALVQEIAKKHDGSVHVLESSAQGTKIELSLYSGSTER